MLKKLISVLLTAAMLIPMLSGMSGAVSFDTTPVQMQEAGSSANRNSGSVVPGDMARATYPESPHPYSNNYSNTWTYTHSSNAAYLDITFSSSTKVETNYDYIYIYNSSGSQIGKYTGTELAGRTITVSGNSFRIKLTTDYSVTYYGFSINQIIAYGNSYEDDYPESAHPYSNNMNRYWYYTHHTSANALKVTFSSSTYFESGWDYLYIYDGTGYCIGSYTGSTLAGKTISITGNSFTLRLYTDGSVTKYGFSITNIASDILANGVLGSNLEWWLSSDGVLSITGSGSMPSYSSASSLPWYSYRSRINKVIVGDYVTSISPYAFSSYSNLSSVTIGSSVSSIGSKAFSGCSNISSVYISDLKKWCNISFSEASSNPLYNSAKLYVEGSPATHINIPSGVTTIAKYAFYNCTNVADVTMSSSVSTVGQYAFYGCSSLTNVLFGSNVVRIDDYAFKNCSSLTNVSLSLPITYIDYEAFQYCYSLLNVYYEGSRADWSRIGIGSNNSYLKNANIHYDGDESLVQVEVLTAPNKRTYYIGDSLNTQGLRIKLTYRDGTILSVNSGFAVSGFDSSTPGLKSVRVSYAGLSAKFIVTIKSPILELTSYLKVLTAGQSTNISASSTPSASITWTTSDSNILTVSNGKISAKNPGTATAYANITYNGITYSKGCEVIVEEHEIQGIYIDRKPYKLTYELGESFDSDGLRIKVKYKDGSADKILTSGYTISGYVSYLAGQKTITVGYSGKVATFTVNVNSTPISSVTLYSPPDKTTYYIGDAVDTSGLRLKLNFSNGNSSILDEGFTVTPNFVSDNTTALTVRFQSITKSVPLSVVRPSVTMSDNSVTLNQGDEYTLTASSDPDSQNITWTSQDPGIVSVDNGRLVAHSGGFTTITAKFTHNGRSYSKSCSVTVKGKVVESIVVQNKPDKLSYNLGEALDTTGLKLKVTYNNREVEYITTGFTIDSYDFSSVGSKTIVVKYGGKSTTFTVSVIALELSTISIETPPDKTEYYIGDSFSRAGLSVRLKFADGSYRIITDGIQVNDFDTSTAGTKKATVTYSGKSTQLTYKVVAPTVSVSLASKSIYIGDSYTLTATTTPTGQQVVWSSSNTNVATVSAGKITARTAGTVDISAKLIYNGIEYSATCKVTVKTPKVDITLASKSINVGESYTLSYTTEPTSSSVTWSSSNPGVATVSAGKVTAIAKGSTVITATLKYGDKTYTDTCNITVKKSYVVSSISVYTIPNKTVYYIGDSFVNTGMKLKVTYTDGTWEIIDSGFNVTGFSSATAGEKTLTAEYSGKTVSFKVNVKNPTVTLSVSTKKLYVGDTYTLSAVTTPSTGSVTWTGSDDGVATVSSSGKVTARKAGTVVITASWSYNGKQYTDKCTVTVAEKVSVSKVELSTLPDKTVYYIGDHFDTTGLKLRVTYSDSTVNIVDSGYDINGFSSSSEGYKIITVVYSGKQVSFNITVKKPTISISASETTIRQDESFVLSASTEPEGISVSWKSSKESVATVSNGTVKGKSPGTANITVSITYNGNTYSKTCSVTVKEKLMLSSLSIYSEPDKKEYYRGDSFDSKGLVVMLRYNDSTTQLLSDGFTVSGFNSQKNGTQTITVSYSGKSATFSVNVKTPSISILSTTYSFETGRTFTLDCVTDPADVQVNWVSDSPKIVSVGQNGKFTAVSEGIAVLTASFKYNSIEYKVTATVKVTAVKATSVVVKTKPDKTEYYVGDAFVTKGSSVTVTFNNGTSKVVTDGLEFSGFDSSSVGTKTVTVSYGGCSDTFTVKINTPYVTLNNSSIKLIPGESYKLTAKYAPSDLTVVWLSSDNSIATVANGNVVARSQGTAVISAQITYNGITYLADSTVNVAARAVTSISISDLPDKLEYSIGEAVDTTGLVLKVDYSDGSSEYVSSGISVSMLNSDALGEQKITVLYGGKSTSFYVEVVLPDMGFTDVKSNHWFALSVAYCVEKGYIAGMSATKFVPNGTLTRAQFVTILAKFDGADISQYSSTDSGFDDVKTNHWYHNAVTWAKVKGYANGLSAAKFGPNNNVTREQLARFFFTYAEKNGMNVSRRADLSAFPDSSKVSAWAQESLEWAVDAKLISGVNKNGVNMLDPRNTATRAQATVMFKAFDALR